MMEWLKVVGSQDGAAVALALGQDAHGSIALAATMRGLLLSRDSGLNWERLRGAISNVPLTAVAISPSFSVDHLAFVGAGDGISLTRDLSNWTMSRLPRANPTVTALVASPSFADDGVILAGTVEDGVLRSSDRGGNFEAWNFGLLDLDVTAISLSPVFGSDETALTATSTGVFRTTNGGRAWRETSLAGTANPILSVAFAPLPNRGLAVAGDEGGNVYSSDDMGRTWSLLPSPLEGLSLNAVLLLATETPTIVTAHELGIHFSSDKGSTWGGWKAPSNVLCMAAQEDRRGCIILLAGLLDGSIYRCEFGAAN